MTLKPGDKVYVVLQNLDGTEQSIDGEVWIGLTDEQADRIARLLDRWALAGAAVGQSVEDWDPANAAEAETIRARLRGKDVDGF